MGNTCSKRFILPLAYLPLLFFSLLIISCSTDNDEKIEDIVTEDSGTVENPDSNEDEGTNTEGDVPFEENVILNAERSFVNFVLPESEYNKFITGEGSLDMVSQKMYEYLNDDFDFMIILSVEDQQPADLFYGRSTSVQNLVQGLGGGIYDLSTTYGSAGKLKSIIYMPRSEYIKSGPFLHEIAHTWGNKGFLPTTVSGHWGYAGTGGQLGGFDELIDNGDGTYLGRLNGQNGFGTFANGGNSVAYGNLELYLMGLIPDTELEPVLVAVNPIKGDTSGAFSADSIVEYTPGMMINENGPRIPSFNNSQKAFSALTVIISKTEIDHSKIDAINLDLENFSRQGPPDWSSSNNFYTATGGKATFTFEVSEPTIK